MQRPSGTASAAAVRPPRRGGHNRTARLATTRTRRHVPRHRVLCPRRAPPRRVPGLCRWDRDWATTRSPPICCERRARVKSTKTTPRPKPSPYVDVILERSPSLRYPGERTPQVVYEWAQMWIEEFFEVADVAAWMDAGLKGNEAHRAAELCREGWTPAAWAMRGEQTG